MTTYYFDWYNGSDSNDGLSRDTPWKSYDGKRSVLLSSDTFLFKRGVPQIISTTNMDAKQGVAGAPTIFGAYGEAQVPYSIWTNPTATGNMILNVSGRSYITFQDMYLDGLGTCQYSLYLFASGSTACVGHRISRCYFTNMLSGQAGLIFGGTSTSTGDTSDYLIEDSHFFKNPGHGLIPNGSHNIRVRRCKFYDNGFDAPFGAHGFSAKFRVTDATSGWTNTSGTIWQRTLAAYETDVSYVRTANTSYRKLTKNTATPTAPTAGEFGVSGGVLYINANSASNPSGQSINYAWGRNYNIVVENCEAWGNISDPDSLYQEGHGFAFDNYTELSTFRGNVSHDNEGAGFSVNLGDGNLLEGNVAYMNGLSAIVVASGKNTTIRHNNLHDNNRGRTTQNGEITAVSIASLDVSNNIFKRGISRRRYAVDIDATCTLTGKTNCVYGYDAVESGSNLIKTRFDDPQLNGEHRPQNPALVRAGTYLGGIDLNGKVRYNPPNIGAVEDETPPRQRTA
jgi:parallel beta-helix repeat protein